MGEQRENIERVRLKIGSSVVRFVKFVGINNTFHADDLRDWVVVETHVAPASSDRILRDLRQKNLINYKVIDRRKSLYKVLGTEEEQMKEAKLFNLSKNTKKDLCEARRCKASFVNQMPGDLWGKTLVKLCEKHTDEAVAYAEFLEKNPQSTPASASEPTALATSETAEVTTVDWAAELKTELVRYVEEGNEVLKVLEDYPVETQADLENVSGFLRDIKGQRNALETLEKEKTGKYQLKINQIRESCKPVKTLWANAEVILKGKIKVVKEREEETNKAALKAAAEAHEAGDQASTQSALSQITTVGDLDGITTRQKWIFDIIDAAQLPKQYMKPDEVKIRAHCAKYKGDETPAPIPGVRFKHDIIVGARSS